jgi:hypothetical protein
VSQGQVEARLHEVEIAVLWSILHVGVPVVQLQPEVLAQVRFTPGISSTPRPPRTAPSTRSRYESRSAASHAPTLGAPKATGRCGVSAAK